MKKSFNTIIIISTIIFLILGLPSILALNPVMYYGEVEKTNAYDVLDESDSLYKETFHFFYYKNSLPEEFNENETSHMVDVLILFSILRFLFLISFVTLIILFFKYKKDKELKTFFSKTKKGTLITLLIMFVLLLFLFVNFNFLFTIFHKVFFPQGNWAFPYNSLLKILFPDSFFHNMAKKIFVQIFFVIVVSFFALLFFESHKVFKKLFRFKKQNFKKQKKNNKN